MVLVVANVYLKEGKKDAFLISAKKCVDATLKESGNISYELNENALVPNKFTFVERWESREALDLHMKQEHFGVFGGEIGDMLANELEIKIYDAKEIQ